MLLIRDTIISSVSQLCRGTERRTMIVTIDGREFPNKQGAVEYYVKKMRRNHPQFSRKKAWAHINVIAEAQERKNGKE